VAKAAPAANRSCIQVVAKAAKIPPTLSMAMPPRIQGVRRPPTSDPCPMRGRVICTA
jgi:hypothetical protein